MDTPSTVSARLGACAIELCVGDITEQQVDAVVNAANTALAGGGGVDGAIHRAAGCDDLLAATRPLGGCAVGDAKITPGFRLPARFVVHAVGPVYGTADAPALLASAYRRSLEVAVASGCRSVAFPWISTGVFGYPMGEAAAIALSTTRRFVEAEGRPELVRFVTFGAAAFEECVDAFRRVVASSQ